MLMLPIPAFIALCLVFLALRAALAGGRGGLAIFLSACALQALGIALAAGYGIRELRPILPVTAAMIPPLAWLAFTAGLFRAPSWREDGLHLAAPAFCLFCRLYAPQTLDLAVSLVFAGYGAAILRQLHRAVDLPLARIAAGAQPRRLWQVTGGLLIALALGDVLISLAYSRGHAAWAEAIISLLASLILLGIGLLSSTPEATGEAQDRADPTPATPDPATPDPATADQDRDILARLDALLRKDRLFLDPGLTLQRLARRMRLPEKRLSAAVNRQSGSNLSRHINTWRIDHACDLIAAGQPITEAMLASGFNTKSNFNREFRRVKGLSPAEWAKRPRPGLRETAKL
ncbi:helix-turn-helix domain-containing protein [Xinfangfangia pollutisoli]|uniref:helix-turn-helix domain-containing protein n=1 Tax=Xinfangfangia pollutisoli TaxID=2865960 RepID=UPI001CD6C5A3|nr:helix-turn-helix domain-containing protein [Xinfangfangia pollutisoli]